jgi:hypothetical protein
MAAGLASVKERKGGSGRIGDRRKPPAGLVSEAAAYGPKLEAGLLRIAADREWIRINRRIAGLETWVNVPTTSYRGVSLRAAGQSEAFEIVLLHIDPSLELTLARASDDTDIIALWRHYAASLGLPLLVEDGEGRLQPVEGADHGPFTRRPGSPLKNRRPRFLARRHAGKMGGQPVHRGEREIVAGGIITPRC